MDRIGLRIEKPRMRKKAKMRICETMIQNTFVLYEPNYVTMQI